MDDKRIDDLVTTVNRIADKLDKVEDISIRNSMVLDRNTDDMAEHIKRTNLLQAQMKTALIPIKVAKWIGGSLAFVSVLVGIIVGVLQLLGKI